MENLGGAGRDVSEVGVGGRQFRPDPVLLLCVATPGASVPPCVSRLRVLLYYYVCRDSGCFFTTIPPCVSRLLVLLYTVLARVESLYHVVM